MILKRERIILQKYYCVVLDIIKIAPPREHTTILKCCYSLPKSYLDLILKICVLLKSLFEIVSNFIAEKNLKILKFQEKQFTTIQPSTLISPFVKYVISRLYYVAAKKKFRRKALYTRGMRFKNSHVKTASIKVSFVLWLKSNLIMSLSILVW